MRLDHQHQGEPGEGKALDTLNLSSLAHLYASAEIKPRYVKWLSTEALTSNMVRLTRDSFPRPNKEAGVAMLLGYSI